MKKRIMHMKFFVPGWTSQNEKRALLSVRKLKPNDYAITTAALEAPLASVRTAAIDRLANGYGFFGILLLSFYLLQIKLCKKNSSIEIFGSRGLNDVNRLLSKTIL